MKIRTAKLSDYIAVARLHRQTIQKVNIKDYTARQVEVWSAKTSTKRFRDSHSLCYRFVAVEKVGGKDKIIGYGDISKAGDFRGLYIHKDFIGQGVGTKLINKLEEIARKIGVKKLTVEATITGKPFYLKRGYKTLKKNRCKISANQKTVFVETYIMQKKFNN